MQENNERLNNLITLTKEINEVFRDVKTLNKQHNDYLLKNSTINDNKKDKNQEIYSKQIKYLYIMIVMCVICALCSNVEALGFFFDIIGLICVITNATLFIKE